MAKNDQRFKYFVKLLGLTNTNSARLDGGDYFCVGSRYSYSSKPLISPISAILKEKILADIAIKAESRAVLGNTLGEAEPLAKYFNRLGIMKQIIEEEKNIQKIFDDGKEANKEEIKKSEVMKKIAPQYKAGQDKLSSMLPNSGEIALEGGGIVKVAARYSPANIYSFNEKEFGFFDALLEANLKPTSVVAQDATEHPIFEFLSNSNMDKIELFVGGFASIERDSEGNCDIFIKKD